MKKKFTLIELLVVIAIIAITTSNSMSVNDFFILFIPPMLSWIVDGTRT